MGTAELCDSNNFNKYFFQFKNINLHVRNYSLQTVFWAKAVHKLPLFKALNTPSPSKSN